MEEKSRIRLVLWPGIYFEVHELRQGNYTFFLAPFVCLSDLSICIIPSFFQLNQTCDECNSVFKVSSLQKYVLIFVLV